MLLAMAMYFLWKPISDVDVKIAMYLSIGYIVMKIDFPNRLIFSIKIVMSLQWISFMNLYKYFVISKIAK